MTTEERPQVREIVRHVREHRPFEKEFVNEVSVQFKKIPVPGYFNLLALACDLLVSCWLCYIEQGECMVSKHRHYY